jgi:prolyl-tRNA synthetase
VRLAIGPRDLENGTVEVARRDTKEKQLTQLADGAVEVPRLLGAIPENIYRRALSFRTKMISKVDTYEEFKRTLDEKTGFILAHWDGTPETEAAIKEETKATIRCIPLDAAEEEGKCVYSGKASSRRVLFARAY